MIKVDILPIIDHMAARTLAWPVLVNRMTGQAIIHIGMINLDLDPVRGVVAIRARSSIVAGSIGQVAIFTSGVSVMVEDPASPIGGAVTILASALVMRCRCFLFVTIGTGKRGFGMVVTRNGPNRGCMAVGTSHAGIVFTRRRMALCAVLVSSVLSLLPIAAIRVMTAGAGVFVVIGWFIMT
jgi:hypothetical protein